MAIATSNFMNEFYNGGFTPEFSVSMLKETIALVRDYVSDIYIYIYIIYIRDECMCVCVCNHVDHGS